MRMVMQSSQFIRNFSIDYIDKNGSFKLSLPEEILNSYFSSSNALSAQSKAVGKEFNDSK